MIKKAIKFIRKHGRLIPIRASGQADNLIKKTSEKAAKHAADASESLGRMMGSEKVGPNKRKAYNLYQDRMHSAIKSEKHHLARADKLKKLKQKAEKGKKIASHAVAAGAAAGTLTLLYKNRKKKKGY